MSTFLTLKQELDTIHGKSDCEWTALHETGVPERLYHYTNAQGLIGILQGKAIWASNVCFMNDTKELVYGREQIVSVLAEAQSRHSTAAVNGFLKACEQRVKEGGLEMDVYAACFCKEGDLLSQWRAYGSMGDGYSLGLCAKSLKIGMRQSFPYILRKVIYDIKKQKKLLVESICNICNLLERACQLLDSEPQLLKQILDEAEHNLDLELKGFLYCFKHPAFKEEQEWRIVHVCPPDGNNTELRFRAVSGKIVPYMALPLADKIADAETKIPLVDIKAGPVLSQVTAKKSLDHLLKFYRYEGIEMNMSGVPLSN